MGVKKTDIGESDVLQTIAHILGNADPSRLDPNANLGDLGLDSLMGVEIKQTLERQYDVALSMKDIRYVSGPEILTKLRLDVLINFMSLVDIKQGEAAG